MNAAEMSIDGGTWVALSSATAWIYTLDTRSLSDGAHTFRARGTDNAGNVESTATLTLIVDNNGPTANIARTCVVPGNGNWCYSPVIAQIGGSDSGSGVSSLTYTLDGQTQTVNAASAVVTVGGGAHTLTAFATDGLGRQSLTQTAEIRVDGAPPVLKFNGGDRSALNVEVSDSESGVDRWTLQVFDANGQTVLWQESFSAFSGAVSWGGSALPAGTYFAEMFARDNAGLESHVPRTAFTLSGAVASGLATPTVQPTSTPQITLTATQTPIAPAQPAIPTLQLATATDQPLPGQCAPLAAESTEGQSQ